MARRRPSRGTGRTFESFACPGGSLRSHRYGCAHDEYFELDREAACPLVPSANAGVAGESTSTAAIVEIRKRRTVEILLSLPVGAGLSSILLTAQRPNRNCIQERSTNPMATPRRRATAPKPAPCNWWTIANKRKPKPMDRYHHPQCLDWNPRTRPLSTSSPRPSSPIAR